MLKMPLGVQAHHFRMDGLHVSRSRECAQELLLHPDFVPVPK